MNKLDYEKTIKSLFDNRGKRIYVANPDIVTLRLFCPHINDEQIASILQDDTYFACPSIFIRNAVIVLHYNTYNAKNQLEYAFISRTPQSYADGKFHRDTEYRWPFMNEAIEYANTHWGDTLILDNWESFMTIHIQDPSKLDIYGYPSNILNLSIALRRDYNAFINEHHKPENEIFDDEIIIVTTDRLIANEIQGDRSGYTEFNCAHCGGGLSLKSCTSCGIEFKDDRFRCGWDTPLSNKMIKALTDAGHVFTIDPKIAQETYRLKFNRIFNKK